MFRKIFLITLSLLAIFGLRSEAAPAAQIFSDIPSAVEEIPALPAIQSEISKVSQTGPIDPDYLEAIYRTMGMVWDERAQALAAEYGLNILNVAWEDTGRYYGSSVGPNISDVTIQVHHKVEGSGDYEISLMPVVRHPNFSDLTADLRLDKFFLLVGNENGEDLERVSLKDYLGDFRRFLNQPDSWVGRDDSLLAPRDTHVLVSAQAAFLPVPEGGKAEFNPVIFNYQSYAGDPAVLTIVATREGTSATVIDNTRNAFPAGFSWGQRLFFNQNGERASLTGERLSDFSRDNSSRFTKTRGDLQVGDDYGMNMVLIIQVPLKQRNPFLGGFEIVEGEVMSAPSENYKSDVEVAVIGHGEIEGPFTEIDGLRIERDPKFPIRVTVQFYKATSNGIVSESDMAEIAAQIEKVYDDGDYVGSLVVGGLSERPTEYDGTKFEPSGWWDAFWQRFEDNTEISKLQASEIIEWLRMVARFE